MNTMKKISTVILLCIFSFVVVAQKPSTAPTGKSDPVMPIYLVDGVETPYAKVVKINTALIASMDVYKGPEAIAKFGAKYKHGIVLVKLKKPTKK
ncbi:MAG: hypothetical protein EBS04_04780 [Chitinophagia bacterium]|jgi:hypothetical protein|nr:hypothetical protein [Chitinophagia bacterium]